MTAESLPDDTDRPQSIRRRYARVSATFWRVFPYNAKAAPGEPFSASTISQGQGAGRFDLPAITPVWYFAETPTHAVAEVIQGLRNQRLEADDLVRFGHPLALVRAKFRPTRRKRGMPAVLDLCDPAVLSRYGIRPDTLASSDISKTQDVAKSLLLAGTLAFRWWSALSGDWHTTVVFQMPLRPGDLVFDEPEILTLQSEAVVDAAHRLAIQIG